MSDPTNRYWLLIWHFKQGEKHAAALRPGDTLTGAWGHPMCPVEYHNRRMFTQGFLLGLNRYRQAYGPIATTREHDHLVRLSSETDQRIPNHTHPLA